MLRSMSDTASQGVPACLAAKVSDALEFVAATECYRDDGGVERLADAVEAVLETRGAER